MKKKETIKTVDVTRLITIAEFNQITLDELLKDDTGNYIIDTKNDLENNDILKMLVKIQNQLQENEENEVKFNGFAMSKESIEITYDAVDILKGLIRDNL